MLKQTVVSQNSVGWKRSASAALKDIRDGVARQQLWRTVAWNEVRHRYRRSFIGPFWLTLSMAVMIAALGFLYAGLLRQPVEKYIPYLAVGLMLWTFISTIILEGCNTFTSVSGIIRQVSIPLTTHALVLIWRNIIIFLHNITIYIIILFIFQIDIGYSVLLIFPAFALYTINALWMSVCVGILCARFRDITMMVASLVQIMFFFTPVIWMPEIIPDRQWVVQYNPVFHFIEIARAPLLGYTSHWQNWAVTLVVTIFGTALAFELFRRYRPRIVFWA